MAGFHRAGVCPNSITVTERTGLDTLTSSTDTVGGLSACSTDEQPCCSTDDVGGLSTNFTDASSGPSTSSADTVELCFPLTLLNHPPV